MTAPPASRSAATLLALTLAAAACWQATMAAAAPPQHISPQPRTKDAPNAGQEETIRVDSDLVSLSVRVTDEQHRPINNLRREDFRILEDGEPQTISFFSTDEAPLSYGLVVCYSGTARAQIAQVIAAGKLMVDGNRPGDETFVARLTSNARPQIQWDFTADRKVLSETLDALSTGTTARTLVDAVYLSVEHVAQNSMSSRGEANSDGAAARRRTLRRRALVLITDGEDRHSFYTQEQLFALLRREEVQIYIVGFIGELKTESGGGVAVRSRRAQSVAFMNRLAADTGGRVFYPNSAQDLPLVAAEITRDLRTQYTLGYSPTNKARDGSFRTLRVLAGGATAGRRQHIAVTRSGYTAPR